jgi:hypothetical protein
VGKVQVGSLPPRQDPKLVSLEGAEDTHYGLQPLDDSDHFEHYLLGALVDGLPHHAVGPLAQLLQDLELPQDVRLQFLGHVR